MTIINSPACGRSTAPSATSSSAASSAPVARPDSATSAASDSAASAAPELTNGAPVTPSGNPLATAGSATDPAAKPTTTAANDNAVTDIVFEDIQLPIQADIVFRPFMLTDRVKALDGQRIRISGYMLPDMKTKNIREFQLLKNTECKFGPGGQADHLINVMLINGLTTRLESKAVSVEGILKINPYTGADGNTWSIYDLDCDKIELYTPRR